MKKVLVTGGSGLLGTSLIYELSPCFDIYAVYNKNKIILQKGTSIKLDLADDDNTKDLIKKINPDVLIHTAAITDPDICETNPKLAMKINIGCTANIAKICSELDIKLIHISTDYVFDGEKGNYKENDKPNPLSVYAKTKLDAENPVGKVDGSIILRMSIYGWNLAGRTNFVQWVINSLRNKKEIYALTDQKTSMIFVNEMAKVIRAMIDNNLSGIYHIGSNGSLSKYQLALKTAEVFGLDPSLIRPVVTEELLENVKWKAKRPKDVSLDVSKIEKTIKMPSFLQGLNHMKELENIYKSQLINPA